MVAVEKLTASARDAVATTNDTASASEVAVAAEETAGASEAVALVWKTASASEAVAHGELNGCECELGVEDDCKCRRGGGRERGECCAADHRIQLRDG